MHGTLGRCSREKKGQPRTIASHVATFGIGSEEAHAWCSPCCLHCPQIVPV